jgi:hypothetical protein
MVNRRQLKTITWQTGVQASARDWEGMDARQLNRLVSCKSGLVVNRVSCRRLSVEQALCRDGQWVVVAGGACVHVGLQARPRWCCKNDADAGGKLRNDYTEFGGAPVMDGLR